MKMTVVLLLIPLIYLFLWYKNYNYCIRFMNYQYFCYMKNINGLPMFEILKSNFYFYFLR